MHFKQSDKTPPLAIKVHMHNLIIYETCFGFALFVTGVIFTCKYFKFGLNATGLSQSHFRNLSACSIKLILTITLQILQLFLSDTSNDENIILGAYTGFVLQIIKD